MLFGVGHVGRQMIRGSVGGAGPPGATLDLSFMNPGTLDPRISFTRAGGPATYFDSNGVMRTAATNLALWSADYTNAVWNKLQTTVTSNAALGPDGTMTASKLVETAVSNTHYMIQARTGSNETLTLSCYLRAGERSSCSLQFSNQATVVARVFFDLTAGTIFATDGPNADYTSISGTIQRVGASSWFRCTLTVTKAAVNTTNAPAVGLYNASSTYLGDGTSGIYVWGVQLEVGTSASAYVPTTSVANGAPRWDYDPATHALRGLLLEEARTNLSLDSGDFTTGNWIPHSVTPTVSATPSPNGTQMMTLVSEVAITGNHYMTNSLTTTASMTYTASVYGKAATNRYLQVCADDTTNGAFATFDLQTGTISQAIAARGTGLPGVAVIQPVGNGIYRCSVTATLGSLTTGRCVALLCNSATPGFAPIYAGNTANGILMWGAQLELGACSTSYIPTTAAAVTRAMDIATMPLGAWHNPLAMSIVADATFEGFTGGISQKLFVLDDGTNSNRFVLGIQNLTTTVFSAVAGVTQGLVQGGTVSANTAFKLGGTLDAINTKMSLNGGAVISIATGSLVSGLTRIVLGGDTLELTHINGWISRARYWPRALSNTELQSVTT